MNHYGLLLSAVSTLICLFTVSTTSAQSWPNWRGPDGNGFASGSGFPTKWTSDQNVRWSLPLTGTGGSTPIVWQRKIFVTTTAAEKNLTSCFDFQGQQLWQTATGAERKGKHRKATGANPSPVTDGSHLFVYFKSGDLACLDLEGRVMWHKNLQTEYGEDTLWWDLGTSPVLTRDAVVVACIQSQPSPSYLLALEKETGELAWKHDRELHAPLEANQSYSTPIVLQRDGQEQIIVLGADHVTCHAASTGAELWRVGGLNPNEEQYFRSIASPVVVGDLVIAPYARGQTLTAIRLGGAGDVTETHVAWTLHDASADVPTPAVYAGRVYVCSDNGKLSCVDPESGKIVWSAQLEKSRSTFSASPVPADGKLYLTREDGTTFVVRIEPDFAPLAVNPLDGDSVVATPVLVDGVLLLRTPDRLYCIGDPQTTE